MSDETRRERGERVWHEVMEFDALPATEPYTQFTIDTVFAELWDRPGLSRRDRRLISLTICAMSAQETVMAAHVAAALSSGDLTADELDEWVLQLSFYGGWPVGSSAVRRPPQRHREGRTTCLIDIPRLSVTDRALRRADSVTGTDRGRVSV